jgi:hypothetical protein
MANRAQLVKQILVELGVYQAGQDLPPEDFRVVDERLPFELSTMSAEDIYGLDDPESVPDEALMPLARYLAGVYAQAFGLSGEELQSVMTGQAVGERTLRYFRARNATYVRQRAEYF